MKTGQGTGSGSLEASVIGTGRTLELDELGIIQIMEKRGCTYQMETGGHFKDLGFSGLLKQPGAHWIALATFHQPFHKQTCF